MQRADDRGTGDATITRVVWRWCADRSCPVHCALLVNGHAQTVGLSALTCRCRLRPTMPRSGYADARGARLRR